MPPLIRLILTTILLGTLGCTTVIVRAPALSFRSTIPHEVLAALPTISVSGLGEELRAGTLFALLIVPVGSVLVEQPQQLIEDAVGRAFLTNPHRHEVSAVSIVIKNLSISVPDLLVTRRIVCSISGSARFPIGGQGDYLSVPITATHAEFRPLAFRPQVTDITAECFRKFARSVVASSEN
jgi:hypothetical protein